MRLKDRILVFLSSVILGVELFWYFGPLLFLLLPFGGLLFIFIGGKKHA